MSGEELSTGKAAVKRWREARERRWNRQENAAVEYAKAGDALSTLVDEWEPVVLAAQDLLARLDGDELVEITPEFLRLRLAVEELGTPSA